MVAASVGFAGGFPRYTEVMGPLLALSHDWQRQRAALRDGRAKPPPLVAAGIDLTFDPEQGRATAVGGLAVIFGHFPAVLGDLVQLVRARLHLGPEQAQELAPVLNNRILAMWAWLPTRHQDCYIEHDRATDDLRLWLIGPGDTVEELDDPATAAELLDDDFLDALVLNGPTGWGGESGLDRLIERFGRRPLLVAARLAELLERRGREPRLALAAARERWPTLDAINETAWAALVGEEHPWTLLQLGRLALRLGLVRAARALLAANPAAELSPVAWFDLGQADEALDDLPGAETAFARYAAARPQDPDAWRRLLFCRLRLDRGAVADETLRRYRAAGGNDAELAERWLTTITRGRLRRQERATLAAWCEAHLGPALAEAGPARLLEDVGLRHGSGPIAPLAADLRAALRATGSDEADAEAVVRTVLLALPLAATAHRGEPRPTPTELAASATSAVAAWWALSGRGGPPPVLDAAALAGLAALAAA